MGVEFETVEIQQMSTDDWNSIIYAAQKEGVSLANYITITHRAYQLLKTESLNKRSKNHKD